MFSNVQLWPKNEARQTENGPCTSECEATTMEVDGKTNESAILATAQASSGNSFSPIVERKEAKPIEIDGQSNILAVAFLADGMHVVSGDEYGKIRRWQVKEGEEVGTPMDAGDSVFSVAPSQDGKWIVSGTRYGLVQVWNAESYEKVTEFKGHDQRVVRAVDLSPDGTKIVTASEDSTACVWSLSGQPLHGPLKHDKWVAAAKFSPDGCLIATATWDHDSVRVYDAQTRNDRFLFDVPIRVNSFLNNSLTWAEKRLFVLSRDGHIQCLDVATGTTLSKWPIHSNQDARCISLASNGKFVAASAGPSVSLWDTRTQKQIGSVIKHTHTAWSMALSTNNDLVTGTNVSISFHSLVDILPQSYYDDKTDQVLRIRLSGSQQAHQEKDDLMPLLHVQEQGSSNSIERLKKTIDELHNKLAESQRAANEQTASLNETIMSLRADLHSRDASSKNEIAYLKRIIRAHEQKHHCEALYAQGRIYDASGSLLQMENIIGEDMRSNNVIIDWLAEFTNQCVKTLERMGDEALNAEKQDEAVAAYSTALSLSPSIPNTVLKKWASTMLMRGSAHEAMDAATKFKIPRFHIHRAIFDILEEYDRLLEATECFRQMQDKLPDDISTHDERVQWELDFRRRCAEKLEKLGDTARDSQKHDEAIAYYSGAITLSSDTTNLNEILLKRSDELIELDPSSHKGYEGKHAALHAVGRYNEAFEAFRMMISKLEQSADPKIRELRHQYFDVTSAIREEVDETIRHLPRVLIDTETGHLYDKTRQAEAFEELPIYEELRSSMTTSVDDSRIRREVKVFYRYVMLSHKWQPGEPTFQQVENISVYKLPLSPTFSKLQNFCKLVLSLRFKWAWSDTCCVNQRDKGIQQESVVAMFRWYRGSSLTIVHLLGVLSESQEIGSLWRSIWNSRGWTYQEYLASTIVQFYTEDWKPYLNLDMYNHKESPIILSEMERAMNFATKELITLRPGFDRAREKLYLASARRTTREEDIAYSLFGIFKVALPVIYGEGNQAVGRLLEHILTRSDDVTLLAWTGRSGSLHSYLPADLTVYNQIMPLHVPPPIESDEMDVMVEVLRSTTPDLTKSVALYEQLYKAAFHPLLLAPGRLRLPCIAFPIDHLVPVMELSSNSDLPAYHATTLMLGDVEIETRDDLSGIEGLLLVHPWISPLLDRDISRGVARFDLATRALRLIVRLKHPFGALLLAPSVRAQYERVATDSLIMVRVREETSLSDLMDGIRTVDVQ